VWNASFHASLKIEVALDLISNAIVQSLRQKPKLLRMLLNAKTILLLWQYVEEMPNKAVRQNHCSACFLLALPPAFAQTQ